MTRARAATASGGTANLSSASFLVNYFSQRYIGGLTGRDSTARVAMWNIILGGLFNSVMLPTIFTLGIDGLDKLTGRGGSHHDDCSGAGVVNLR